MSPKTEEAINIWMPLFIEFTQKTPDELIEEALAGKQVVKERLSDFCTWLQDIKNKKYNTAIHGSYHLIRGFYSHNDINTQKIQTPTSPGNQACHMPFMEWNTSSIPDFATITQVKIEYDVTATAGTATDCRWKSLSTNPPNGSTTYGEGMNTGTTVYTNDALCKTTGDDKEITLNSSGKTALQNKLSDGFFGVGIHFINHVRDGTEDQVDFRADDARLEVTYTP